jgi:hypothetical protein
MATIQVASVRDHSGTGKESGKAYKMRIAKVIATDDSGVVELGEITFFEGSGRPFPNLAVGAKYEPQFGFTSEKGKLIPTVTNLLPSAK